jgi:hypothetical protein
MTADYSATTSDTLQMWAKRQRSLLHFGACFSGAFGIVVLVAPHLLSPLVPKQIGDAGIWLRLDGIFLLFTAFIYWATALDPERYLANVIVMIAFKAFSVVYYVVWVVSLHATPLWLIFAVADSALFGLHIHFIGPPRISRILGAFTPAHT